jgi:hypothetical protein
MRERKSTGHDNNSNSNNNEKKRDRGVVGWTPFSSFSFFF